MFRTKALLVLASLFMFISYGSVYAHNQAVVIPLPSKSSAFKGNLYQTIPFAGFESATEETDYNHAWFFASLGYLVINSGSLNMFNAPVILPDNAVVNEISLSATDNNDGGTITIYFNKVALNDTTVDFIPDQTGTDSSTLGTDETGIISTAIDNEVIDNQNYYYFVYALFNGSSPDYLKAVRIGYTLP